jgi:hypothetical protein
MSADLAQREKARGKNCPIFVVVLEEIPEANAGIRVARKLMLANLGCVPHLGRDEGRKPLPDGLVQYGESPGRLDH